MCILIVTARQYYRDEIAMKSNDNEKEQISKPKILTLTNGPYKPFCDGEHGRINFRDEQ
jgi:CDGSH-type Zn-finger protein